MAVVHQNRNCQPIRVYLLTSLLLHGLLFLLAIRLLPSFIREQSEPAIIIMTNLATPPSQKTGPKATAPVSRSMPVTRPPSAPARTPAPLQNAILPSPTSSPLPAKSSVPALKMPVPSVSSSYQDKAVNLPRQATSGQTTPHPSSDATVGHSQPQEMTFGSASGPAFLKQAMPIYPALAKRRNREGVVHLRLSISETGQLTRVEVLEDPGFGFAEAAQEAVRNSSFSPAHYNGKPIAIRATLPVRFTLR